MLLYNRLEVEYSPRRTTDAASYLIGSSNKAAPNQIKICAPGEGCESGLRHVVKMKYYRQKGSPIKNPIRVYTYVYIIFRRINSDEMRM